MGMQLRGSFVWDASSKRATVGEVNSRRSISAHQFRRSCMLDPRCRYVDVTVLLVAHTHRQDEGFVQLFFRVSLMTPLPIHLVLL